MNTLPNEIIRYYILKDLSFEDIKKILAINKFFYSTNLNRLLKDIIKHKYNIVIANYFNLDNLLRNFNYALDKFIDAHYFLPKFVNKDLFYEEFKKSALNYIKNFANRDTISSYNNQKFGMYNRFSQSIYLADVDPKNVSVNIDMNHVLTEYAVNSLYADWDQYIPHSHIHIAFNFISFLYTYPTLTGDRLFI